MKLTHICDSEYQNIHNVYNEYQNAFKSVLDKHAPVKNRYNIEQIKVNSFLSNWADIHKGVPQGSILGPSYSMSS